MLSILQKLKKQCVFGFVGGSDLIKQKEQLGEDCTSFFDYAFAENGLTAIRQNKSLSSQVSDFFSFWSLSATISGN